jgi:hypothetical protein
MSVRIEQTAEAFSRHRFEECYHHLAADIRWRLVGGREIVGRDAVIAACEDSAGYLRLTTTTFTAFQVMVGPDFAVVDSTAEYVDTDGDRSVVASCDIYRFSGEQLVAITSYNIELT